jgi:thioredoxin reductase (NADPH)
MPRNSSVIIIGSGPAGLTAAIYAGARQPRARRLRRLQYGGQLMLTTEVENFPRLSERHHGPGTDGEFPRAGRALRIEDLQNVDVTKVDFSQRPFKVWDGDDEYEADTVIVATGASARWLGRSG